MERGLLASDGQSKDDLGAILMAGWPFWNRFPYDPRKS